MLILGVLHRDMDRQHIQDREKWKRETATKIKETKVGTRLLACYGVMLYAGVFGFTGAIGSCGLI